mgnify:CR=1 FL=1
MRYGYNKLFFWSYYFPITIFACNFYVNRNLAGKEAASYIAAQVMGAALGAIVANLMFGSSWFEVSEISRFSLPTFLGEIVATWGLVLVILLLVQLEKTNLIAAAVALWIFAGHLFTSSTSFANPAVTIGRIFSEAPSGISPDSALWFAVAQFVGMAIALLTFEVLTKKEKN